MAGVRFAGVGKRYGGGDSYAVKDLDLEIADGEFMVLVGPSGCGKSTALRMIAGLEEVTDGDLYIGDERVNDRPPGSRDVAMVFQNYALYPHMTVRENMGFALEMAKVKKDEIKRRVDLAAGILDLTEYLERTPKQLSGGQRQRVAMGRAIVREPAVFLMDEPLSNLDAKLRVQMRSEIIRLQQDLATTTVYVTHDQIEAMTMGHRVAVMRKGTLQQVASPQELYDRPDNLFVATFIGSPSMNIIDATIEGAGDDVFVSFAGHRLRLDPRTIARYPLVASKAGQRVVLGIRPEHIEDAASSALPEDQRLDVKVEVSEAMGSETHVHFTLDVPPVATEDVRDASDAADDDVALRRGETKATAKLDGTVRARSGDVIRVAVRTHLVHLFDYETGRPLR
jgi:multiple sugar transport system ATP-binding protein